MVQEPGNPRSSGDPGNGLPVECGNGAERRRPKFVEMICNQEVYSKGYFQEPPRLENCRSGCYGDFWASAAPSASCGRFGRSWPGIRVNRAFAGRLEFHVNGGLAGRRSPCRPPGVISRQPRPRQFPHLRQRAREKARGRAGAIIAGEAFAGNEAALPEARRLRRKRSPHVRGKEKR